jgi:hypothetical protein
MMYVMNEALEQLRRSTLRTRIFVTAILLVAFLTICSIPVVCEETAPPAAAPAAPVAPADAAKPAEPAPAAPVAPADAAKPAEPAPAAPVASADAAKPAEPAPAAPAKPSALATPPTAPAPVVVGQPGAKVETPEVTPDTNIFKRTPKLDGVVEDGEWDAFYTYKSGDLDLTTYADWDSANLYIAAKSNKPVDLLALLDANSDGWYNGEDNYEFRVVRGAEGASKLIVNRYDSRRTKSPSASAVTPEEAALVEMKSSVKDGMSSVEIRIPGGLIRKFKLADNRKIGLLISARTGSDEASWIASGSPGDTKESILVSKKIVSLKPLDLGFDLRDAKIARGDELVAKFHLANVGADTVDVRSFVIAGEGKAGDFLSSEKVRMEGLAPKKHVAHDVRSVIPNDMPLGSWALGAEVKSSDNKLGGALLSFDVVEPFELALRLPNEPVKPTVKEVTVGIVITNNMRRNARGEARITMPAGWELWKNDPKREFSASGKSLTTVAFKMKPPLGALGQVPVKMDVTINGKTMSVEGEFTMVGQ